MTTALNKEDYLERKLSGEKVISAATVFGYKVMTMNPSFDNFMVLAVNERSYSYYCYDALDGRFHVVEYGEGVAHEICNYVTPEMMREDSVTRWWNCVFYENNGVYKYDNYYDDLKIYNDSDTTFKSLISNVSKCVFLLLPVKTTKHLFLTGDLMKNPILRYVLHQKMTREEMHLLPEIPFNDEFDENEIIILPDRLKQLALNTIEMVRLKEIISVPISITLPLDSLNKVAVVEARWKDLLVNEQEDFSIGPLKYKTINLHVECDCFQHIFVYSEDLRGNRKVIKI